MDAERDEGSGDGHQARDAVQTTHRSFSSLHATRVGADDGATTASSIGRNPFLFSTMQERDENFPNFDQAMTLLPASLDQSCADDDAVGAENDLVEPSLFSCNLSVALSISARAALNEHNRHVARYGIDDSIVWQENPAEPPNLVSSTHKSIRNDSEAAACTKLDPLDVEWDRLLSSNASSVNLSGFSSSRSIHSADNNIPFAANVRLSSDTRHRSTHLDSSHASSEGIEVVKSDLSVSDYFNTSKVFALRTPEHSLFVSHPVTVRNCEDADVDNDSSHKVDVSDTLTPNRIQELLLLSTVSAATGGSSSVRPLSSNENSILLANADLSRISASGSDFHVDVSFNSYIYPGLNESEHDGSTDQNHSFAGLDVNNRLSRPVDPDGIKQHQEQTQSRPQRLPFINMDLATSPNRRGKGLQLTPKRDRVHRHLRNSSFGSSSSSHRTRTSLPSGQLSAALTPSRPAKPRSTAVTPSLNTSLPPQSPLRRSPNESFSSHPFGPDVGLGILELSPITKPPVRLKKRTPIGADDETDWRHEMLGLSPISKQAAESAMLHLMQSSPLAWKAQGLNQPTQLGAASAGFGLRKDYESGLNSQLPVQEYVPPDDYRGQFSSSVDDSQACPAVVYEASRDAYDVSPLHSSSEKRDSSRETSAVIAANQSDLKKSSLSSITPNSSSEHQVSTSLLEAPTSTRIIVSPHNSAPLPPREGRTSPLSMNSTRGGTGSGEQNSVLSVAVSEGWHPHDRRRYRTVVPLRVYMTEPMDFPNEDDSFSISSPRRRTLSSPSSVVSKLQGNEPPVPTAQASVPGGVPRGRRLGDRSVQSSPQ